MSLKTPIIEYVERVAILNKEGEIILATPEMMLLNPAELRFMATQLQGRVGWKKFEVTMTPLANKFCEHRDCWALAENGSNYCGKHYGV